MASGVDYGTTVQLSSTASIALADGSWFSSGIYDNSTNKNTDVMVNGTFNVGSVTADGTIDLYIDYSVDGTEFAAGVDAGHGPITWGTTGNTTVNGEFNLVHAGSINVDATDDSSDIPFGIPSIAALCNGVMPKKFVVVVENNTNNAFDGTGTNNHIDATPYSLTFA